MLCREHASLFHARRNRAGLEPSTPPGCQVLAAPAGTGVSGPADPAPRPTSGARQQAGTGAPALPQTGDPSIPSGSSPGGRAPLPGPRRVRSQPHREEFIRFPVPVLAITSLFSFLPAETKPGEPGSGSTLTARGQTVPLGAVAGCGRARLCPSDWIPGGPQSSEVYGAWTPRRWDSKTCPGWRAGQCAA